MGGVQLPPRTWRVVFEEGFGWPECTHRTRTTRRFDNARDVARFLATLARWPDHHRLVGVWESDCRWVQNDPTLFAELLDDQGVPDASTYPE